MISIELRPNEIDILKYRDQGLSWKECARRMGYKHYQQGMRLYSATIKKVRKWNHICKTHPEFLITAKRFGKTQRWMFRFYDFMEQNNLLDRWNTMSNEELKAIPGFGRDYLWFVNVLRSQSAKEYRV